APRATRSRRSARTPRARPRWRSSSRPKRPRRSSTRPSRSTAAAGSCAALSSSTSTARCAPCASTRARRRSRGPASRGAFWGERCGLAGSWSPAGPAPALSSMKLFTPIDLGTMRLANRVVVPAMVTRLAGEDGRVTDELRARYLRFAKGRPGLIVIEAMSVHGGKSGPLLRLSSDQFIAGQADLARQMKEVAPGLRVVPQIIHFLKIARSGWRQKPGDLSKEEIRRIVVQYGQAAERARRCGYDGVELHMAHAYTVSSFLSRLNQRPDEYGRSLEDPIRLMTEILLEVRARAGADFPVGVRYDGEERIKNAYSLQDSRVRPG